MGPGLFGFFGRGHCGPKHGGGHCGPSDCGPPHWAGHHGGPFGGGRGWHGGPPGGGPGDFDGDGGGFGVKRPLRFLAWKLELEEEQVAKLAVILDELKTERAQAAVDQRRSIAAFADAVGGTTFDAAKAKEAGDARVKTAERVRDAVFTALERMHAVLDDEQRQRLAYLLRTGALTV